MGRDRTSVDSSLPQKLVDGDESVDAASEERTDDEDPSEEDPLEEEFFMEEDNSDEEREHYATDANVKLKAPEEDTSEDEEPFEDEPDKEGANEEVEEDAVEEQEEESCDEEPSEELEACEVVEEDTAEDPDEEPEGEESYEEEPSEELVVQSPYGSYNDETCPSKASEPSSEKNRRSEEILDELFQGEKSKQDPDDVNRGTNLFKEQRKSTSDENVSKQEVNVERAGKKRRSRWDIIGHQLDGTTAVATKKWKSRWSVDDTQLKMLDPLKLSDNVNSEALVTFHDPKVRKLLRQLHKISQKMRDQSLVDAAKVSSGKARITLGRLKRQKKEIISELIRKNPSCRPPPKLYKKLYIPTKEYPGYNLVGRVVGRCGLRRKRMEKETGARILIGGKGCVREDELTLFRLGASRGPHKDGILDSSENEDLHVHIEAETQQSLDAAVKMVEKLLFPVKEGMSKQGNKGSFSKEKTFKTSESCNVCGDADHLTSSCPLIASTPESSLNTHQANFIAEVGDCGPFLFGKLPGPISTSSSATNSVVHGSSEHNGRPAKEHDESNLFVGQLPKSVNTDKLIALFKHFGPIEGAKVANEKTTCLSKGYGFVKYVHPVFATKAVAHMNGYEIEGKRLVVCVSGTTPSTASSNLGQGQPSSEYTGRLPKEVDESKLFVRHLPDSLNTHKLIELFQPFGPINEARVAMDRTTGLSKCYGFVRYVDPVFATKAMARMNGYEIEGKRLAIRVAGEVPSTISSNLGPAAPPSTTCPPGSVAPKASTSFTKNSNSSLSSQHVAKPSVPFSGSGQYLVSPAMVGDTPSADQPGQPSSWTTNSAVHGSSAYNSKPPKQLDESNLFVGHLPGSVDTDKLIQLFLPFGPINEAKVMVDRTTGLSKGYGFVRYVDPAFAIKAIARMNGYEIEGKRLTIAVAGKSHKAPSTVSSNLGPAAPPRATHLPTSQGPIAINSGNLTLPGSMLPEPSTSFTKNSSLSLYSQHVAKPSIPFSALGQYLVSPSMVGDATPSADQPGKPESCSACTTNSVVHSSSADNGKPPKQFNESNLYVGHLPGSVDTDKLIQLFLPFGLITEAKVIVDRTTGLSKGYGFVRYVDPAFATDAIARMNGYEIEGKRLTITIAGKSHKAPSTVSSNLGPAAPPSATRLPTNHGPIAINSVNATMPVSVLPEPSTSFTKNSSLSLYFQHVAKPSVPFSASGQYLVSPSMVRDPTTSSDQPGKPASMAIDPHTSARSNDLLLYSHPAGGTSVPYHASGQHLAPPPVFSGPITSADELKQVPGYLKRFDSTNPYRSTSSDTFSLVRRPCT